MADSVHERSVASYTLIANGVIAITLAVLMTEFGFHLETQLKQRPRLALDQNAVLVGLSAIVLVSSKIDIGSIGLFAAAVFSGALGLARIFYVCWED